MKLSHSGAMELAIQKAKEFRGSTSPNPPVGAVILDETGEVLAAECHQRAGEPHAEVHAFRACQTPEKAHTLIVTLEPCNHHGRTPPCTEAVLASSIRHVVVGTTDPNPKVQGRGITRLREAGLQVTVGTLESECQELIRPFAWWMETRQPWITVKQALQRNGSMIPPPGMKTFTSSSSLRLAHELRKRCDALLTGSGTILADNPEFTVRHVPDFLNKRRFLVVLDRKNRVSSAWKEKADQNGFTVIDDLELEEAIPYLGSQGTLEVLVEAGPTLTEALLTKSLWNEWITIQQGPPDQEDRVEIRINPQPLKLSRQEKKDVHRNH